MPPVEEAEEVTQETDMTGANQDARDTPQTIAEIAAVKTRARDLKKVPMLVRPQGELKAPQKKTNGREKMDPYSLKNNT